MATAKSIIDKAAILLQDIANTRHTRTELLGWLNDARRQIVMHKPSFHNQVTSVQLKPGTHQHLPDDGYMLLGISHNMGTDGITPGPSIRIISREVLDSHQLNWHQAPQDSVVQNYIYSLQDTTAFYVYPPNDGLGYIKINYVPFPPDLTTETEDVGVHAIFQGLLTDYVVYRAASKDAEHAPGMAMSQRFYESFMTGLMGKDQGEAENNPNLGLAPASEPKVS